MTDNASAAVDRRGAGDRTPDLHLWQRLDWRFLLPNLGLSDLAYAGDIDTELAQALALLNPDAASLDEFSGKRHGVVVVNADGVAALDGALAAVRPGGWAYIECRRRPGRAGRDRSVARIARRLRLAGWLDVRSFWLPPNLNSSTRMLQPGDAGVVRATLARHDHVRLGALKALVGRLFLRVGLFASLLPEGVVVARRGPGEAGDLPFVDKVLAENRAGLGLAAAGLAAGWETVLLTPRFATSRHVVALVHPLGAAEPAVVVKVPRQPDDNEAVQREAAILTQLGERGIAHAPRLLGRIAVRSHDVLVETAVLGQALDPYVVAADRSGAVSAGIDFVNRLPITESAATNQDWYARLIAQPLERLARLTPLGGEIEDLCRRTHEVLHSLRRRALPAVFEHGDLSHPNLFLRDGELHAIDWERARPDGLPGHDLTFLLQYLAESARGAFTRQDQLATFSELMGPNGWGTALVSQHLVRRGVDPKLTAQLIVASWARSAATLADRLTGSPAALSDVVGADRDVWLWRHAVEQAERGWSDQAARYDRPASSTAANNSA